MSSKEIISNHDSDKTKEDALLDETMKLIAGYEEGLSARDFKSMSDCNCQTHDDTKEVINNPKRVINHPKIVANDPKIVTSNHKNKK